MREALARYAGLYIPPLAWAIDVELGLLLPHADCGRQGHWSLIASLMAMAAALASAFLSRQVCARADGRMQRFLGRLAFITGLAFAFALLLQVMAAGSLNPCLR